MNKRRGYPNWSTGRWEWHEFPSPEEYFNLSDLGHLIESIWAAYAKQQISKTELGIALDATDEWRVELKL